MASLIGVFDKFVVDGTGLSGPAEAFCQITSACGKYRLSVEIHDLAKGNAIAGGRGPEIDIPNRLMRANVIIPIPRIPFPHPGLYDFLVLANGDEIDRQQFEVSSN